VPIVSGVGAEDRRQPVGIPLGKASMHSRVEVVIPVYNEERVLAASIRCLHAYLRNGFPYPFILTIADNASTDATLMIAR
jgi:hypothetical protein